MIYFVNNGVRIDEEEWSGAYPRPDLNPKYSSIDVSFQNGTQISLTEDFLRHCLDLIEHTKKQIAERIKK